ncbi:MAG: glycosyltransferase [Janthinobacterium lividum]
MRVLYFTVVPLAANSNGGSICCRNHVARLAADTGIELTAMVAGPPEDRDATETFFAALGVRCHFQPFRGGQFHPEGSAFASVAAFAAKALFHFPWELQALNQPHIQEGIDWAIKGYTIDTLVIDYHSSTLFLRLPRNDVRTVLIGLNREGDFYADMIRLGLTHHVPLTAGISLRRARRFERRIDASVDKVVTIGPPDLPRHRLRAPAACITPYLDPKPERWRCTDPSRVFFVGNIAHYPNRLAIEWLTRRFAPVLLELDGRVRISIVGATASDVDAAHRHANIDFLGTADASTLTGLFLGAGLMLCPIENDYGVKFKAVEALSYGTPLLASRQTLLGLPHLSGIPMFDLDRPDEAAALVRDLALDPGRLVALGALQQRQQAAFIATQGDIWSRTIAPPGGRRGERLQVP